MPAFIIFGRVLFAALFIYSGATKLADIQGAAHLIGDKVMIPALVAPYAAQIETATGMTLPYLLAIASGAGAGSKHAIGTGVIGGMLTAAVLAIFWIPLFYVMICSFFDRTDSASEGVKEDSL